MKSSSLSAFPNLDLSLNILSPVPPPSKKTKLRARASNHYDDDDTHKHDGNDDVKVMKGGNIDIETSTIEEPPFILKRNNLNHYDETATATTTFSTRSEENDIILNYDMSNSITENNTAGASTNSNVDTTMTVHSSSRFIRSMNTRSLNNNTSYTTGDDHCVDAGLEDKDVTKTKNFHRSEGRELSFFNSSKDNDHHIQSGGHLSTMSSSTENEEKMVENDHQMIPDESDNEFASKTITNEETENLDIDDDDDDDDDDDVVVVEVEKNDAKYMKDISEFDSIMDEAAQMIGEAETYLDEMRMIQVKNAILMDSLVIVGA